MIFFDRFRQGLIRPTLLAAGLALAAAGGAAAQQSQAAAGSPAATRVIDGLQLPAPGVPFGGTISCTTAAFLMTSCPAPSSNLR